jgi:hypothetical protein
MLTKHPSIKLPRYAIRSEGLEHHSGKARVITFESDQTVASIILPGLPYLFSFIAGVD